MKLKMAALPLLLALMAMTAQAQRKWTLQECLDYALEHNIQLQKNRLTEAQDREDIQMRRAALLPSLSFSTNQNASWRPWSQSYVNLSGGTMTSTSSEVNYNGSYGLNAQWTVWNGGRNQKNLEKSKLTAEMAEYATAESANTIQEQITQLYVRFSTRPKPSAWPSRCSKPPRCSATAPRKWSMSAASPVLI